MSFVHRFGASLNRHRHCCIIDGVFDTLEAGGSSSDNVDDCEGVVPQSVGRILPNRLTLPAMESEAQAGSPRQASARACRRRGAGAAGPGAVEAVCRAHPTRRRAIRRRVMAESDRPHRGLVVTAP